MPVSYVDRSRAGRLMGEARIDALLLFQPENVAFASSVNPGVAGMFRKAGAAAAIIPADQGQAIAAVMPDLLQAAMERGSTVVDVRYHMLWIGTMRTVADGGGLSMRERLPADAGLPPRPATFDAMVCYRHVRDQLSERGLLRGRIGVDLSFVSAVEFERIKSVLPEATLVDATEVIGRLRMVKTAPEIEHLRQAVSISEVGVAAAEKAARAGVLKTELSDIYGQTVAAEARRRGAPYTGRADHFSIGPEPWGLGKPLEAGDVVRFDYAVLIAGYASDMARTRCFGTPSRAAREVHAALREGLEAGLAAIRPGAPLKTVYATMLDAVRKAGVVGYRRGHFGHSVGADVFGEEWPFISADADVIIEPGMVLAVEAPLYVDGLGGFIVEDQVLVTETGVDNMSTSDKSFYSLG